MRAFWLILLFVSLTSCQTLPPPVTEYALARSAMDSAKAVQAAKHSPGYWHQAEEAYRKARVLYRSREYEEAKIEFNKARAAAEKAENSARVIRQKTGDVI